MSKHDLIPAFYDGQDRSKAPLFLKSRVEIKQQRKLGALNGSFQENGSVFIVYRAFSQMEDRDCERLIAAGCMADAWSQVQSGYGGPMVLQMPRADRFILSRECLVRTMRAVDQ